MRNVVPMTEGNGADKLLRTHAPRSSVDQRLTDTFRQRSMGAGQGDKALACVHLNGVSRNAGHSDTLGRGHVVAVQMQVGIPT